ncbi:hypothetical protein [Falsirhodobacter algicola]|uniref:Uncharacterized protein n=1 Tax=Falsirhodobacter algicola TaxID=2692330 RepID=A0A8J8SLN6_9RHOB|nr:hypothetical protein [Falsirhodobacter algicola]QUS36733.1 hypothetical protein GR316_10950 [Falsirhodobacter algicola]
MTRSAPLIAAGLVVLACYAVPYLIIGHIAAWYGSFLFWVMAGVAIIVLNVAATADLKDDVQ